MFYNVFFCSIKLKYQGKHTHTINKVYLTYYTVYRIHRCFNICFIVHPFFLYIYKYCITDTYMVYIKIYKQVSIYHIFNKNI